MASFFIRSSKFNPCQNPKFFSWFFSHLEIPKNTLFYFTNFRFIEPKRWMVKSMKQVHATLQIESNKRPTFFELMLHQALWVYLARVKLHANGVNREKPKQNERERKRDIKISNGKWSMNIRQCSASCVHEKKNSNPKISNRIIRTNIHTHSKKRTNRS